MWLLFALATVFLWSGSDLFSKIGCRDKSDRVGPLKMVVSVGLVMGLHAFYEIFVNKVPFSKEVMVQYLPVSALYIVSMGLGYFGLRYIELSITSPICNTSGGIVVLLYLFMGERPNLPTSIALVLIIGGVFALGVTEFTEDEVARAKRQMKSNYQYSKSLIAILFPILYSILDALGTFGDSLVLQRFDERGWSEDMANISYELTFLAVAIVVAIYLTITKKWNFSKRRDGAKLVGAVFETAGQFFYIFALAKNAMLAAPVMSCYCLLSVVWGQVILKERMSWKHYLSIGVALVGIVMLAVFNPDA